MCSRCTPLVLRRKHTRRHCSVIGQVAWPDPGVFPVIPKNLKRLTTVEGNASAAAVGAGDADMDAASAASQSGTDSDVDADAHDFTADGVLPEALTSLHTVKTASERAAQLASDCHLVSSIIGMADTSSRYPNESTLFASGRCSR